VFFILGLFAATSFASSCETSTSTFTRDSSNVTSVVISSDVGLTVTLVEGDSFELSVSFYGRDSALSVCTELMVDDSTWTLNVGASAATDPPSSANSQIFFSSAQTLLSFPTIAVIRTIQTAYGQCTETASVTLSAAAGWSVTEETSNQVTVSYFGPKAYGYDLSLAFPGETVSSWSSEDETLLLANLASFYNDPSLFFTVSSRTDVDGVLVVVVNVLGFATSSSASTAHDIIASGGLQLADSQFSSVTATASVPGISCSMGFSTADSSDVCSDTDGCLSDTCSDEGDDLAVCLDARAPEVGWSCNCSRGWEDNSGTCGRVTCEEPEQNQYVMATGDSVFEAIRTVTCATGYEGTASDITCQADGTWTASSGCTIRDCGSPVAGRGYTVGSGSTTYGSTYTMTCATGYAGTAASLTCQASATWTAQSGCTIRSCSSSPSQTGYTFGSGSSTYEATRTSTCATGYTGTASSITCQADATWSAASGCTIRNCGTPTAPTGYALGSGSTTYGSTYTMTCAVGYIGTAASLTCQSSGSWTTTSGCTIRNCGTPVAGTGYANGSGSTTYGS